MSDSSGKILVRELEERDLGLDYFTTLSNLANVGKIIFDKKHIVQVYITIKKKSHSKIFVALIDNKIVGSITTLIEHKFIHNGGKVCHIEDVVTRKGYENLGIGSLLVKHAIDFAALENCYKAILTCSEENVRFYERSGFHKHEVGMRLDLE